MQGQQQQQLLATHRELLSQPTQSPLPQLTHAVDGFLEQLTLLHSMKCELAAVAPADGCAGEPEASGSLASLPEIMRIMHEFLIQVAARVARLRDASTRLRAAHLQVHIFLLGFKVMAQVICSHVCLQVSLILAPAHALKLQPIPRRPWKPLAVQCHNSSCACRQGKQQGTHLIRFEMQTVVRNETEMLKVLAH